MSSDDVSTGGRRRRRARGGGLSIQSKLLIMLLSVSLVSSIIVGAIGFINGRTSLQDSAIDQLITIRSMRAAEIQTSMEQVKRDAMLNSRNLSAQNMSKAINAGFAALEDVEISPEQQEQLEQYHAEAFIPMLSDRSGEEYGDTAFIPESAAGRYVQLQYTTQNRTLDDAGYDAMLVANDAGDGTAYSAATEQYGDYFQRLVEQAGYEDALLIDLDGDVVFSAYKGVELGTNLHTGPFRDSLLAEAYDSVLARNSVNTVELTDFERWIPSLNVPTMWVVSPVGNDSGVSGAIAFQISLDTINAMTTGDEGWKEQGLGNTGEVYLVGRDRLMRSSSRYLIEDADTYEQRAIAGGTPPAVAKRIVEVQGTVLLQPVTTDTVGDALAGQSGFTTGLDYLGGDSLTAYAPLGVDDLDWVIIARIDSAEAFAPVADFTRTVLLSLLAILLVVSMLSLLLAQVFTRPIHKLVSAVRRVSEGDLDVRVAPGGRDELGDLGNAFNDMASSLQTKQELIDQQRTENEKLLRTLMPGNVAERYKNGEETITEAHDDVAVIFAELVGFDGFAGGLTAEQEVAHLNTLMRGFDEAAEQTGVEKVRTLHDGYLASCGLAVPRVDQVRRVVDFALRLRDVIERFNTQNGASIGLRAGVDVGTVSSGLVARTNLAYDLWGDAVNIAYSVRGTTAEPGIYVSQAVHDRTGEFFTYTRAGAVDVQGASAAVWKVD